MLKRVEKVIKIKSFSISFNYLSDDADLNRELRRLIQKISDNLEMARDVNGKKFYLGYAEIRIKMTSDNQCILEEFIEHRGSWDTDLTRSLYYLKRQIDFCEKYNLVFSEIAHDALVGTNFGTKLNDELNFDVCRYEVKNHSGLLITDSHFDGNMRKVKLYHLSHLIANNPDLIDIVGIASGFYVNVEDGFVRAGKEGVG